MRLMYGYEIVQHVTSISEGQLQWSAGTLYPLLHSLENKGVLESMWREAESGPRRKYYRLTPKGEKALQAEKRQWMRVHEALVRLWGPGLSPAQVPS